MTRPHLSDAQVSIRLIWPFARLVGSYPSGLATLSRAGVGPAEYANPDTRIPLRTAVELLNGSIERSGDPALGLRAGELIEPGDFDALEYAARSCATSREAIHVLARYARLMSDAAEVTLVETSSHASLRFIVNDVVPMPPAVNDFCLAALYTHAKRQTELIDIATEIQFTHAPTTYVDQYSRVFGAKVTFNSKYNALVARREWLDAPQVRANPRLSAAFELQAGKLMKKLEENETIGGKVRALVLAKLSQGDVSMESVAGKLMMSVATLRRRLDQEGLAYSEIVEALREELARRYLRESGRAISEVAFLLGFSDVISFHKAFKRWTGMTPADFRTTAHNP